MVQWINLNQNNRSMVECQYPLLWEKTEPILPSLVSKCYGRQAGRQDNILSFVQVKLFGFDIGAILSSKFYVLKYEKFSSPFSYQSLLLNTITLNNAF